MNCRHGIPEWLECNDCIDEAMYLWIEANYDPDGPYGPQMEDDCDD